MLRNLRQKNGFLIKKRALIQILTNDFRKVLVITFIKLFVSLKESTTGLGNSSL